MSCIPLPHFRRASMPPRPATGSYRISGNDVYSTIALPGSPLNLTYHVARSTEDAIADVGQRGAGQEPVASTVSPNAVPDQGRMPDTEPSKRASTCAVPQTSLMILCVTDDGQVGSVHRSVQATSQQGEDLTGLSSNQLAAALSTACLIFSQQSNNCCRSGSGTWHLVCCSPAHRNLFLSRPTWQSIWTASKRAMFRSLLLPAHQQHLSRPSH